MKQKSKIQDLPQQKLLNLPFITFRFLNSIPCLCEYYGYTICTISPFLLSTQSAEKKLMPASNIKTPQPLLCYSVLIPLLWFHSSAPPWNMEEAVNDKNDRSYCTLLQYWKLARILSFLRPYWGWWKHSVFGTDVKCLQKHRINSVLSSQTPTPAVFFSHNVLMRP